MIENARTETVDIDDVERPNPSERLHPDNDEEEDEWEEFKESVGTNPIHNPIAKKNGDTYEIIVGDRRTRAMEENGAEEIDLEVVDDLSTDELYALRVSENHHRKGSNKRTEAEYLAQLCRPWLLLPAERADDIEVVSQTEAADMVGVSEGWVSQLLNNPDQSPLVRERPLRHVLGKKAPRRQLSEDEIETVDNILNLLTGGEGHKVIAEGEENWISNRLEDCPGVSFSEIETMAEKAVEEGWTGNTFLEQIHENYENKDQGGSANVESRPLGGEDPFADTSPDRSFDEGNDAGPASEEDEDGSNETTDHPDFGEPNISVDWDELLDEEMLSGVTGAEDLRDVKVSRWQDVSLQDDAAIMMNALAEATARPGETEEEAKKRVRENFLERVFVEAGAEFLSEELEEETEVAPAAE
jgi:ParB/RepB/Spo0J family partition protein